MEQFEQDFFLSQLQMDGKAKSRCRLGMLKVKDVRPITGML